MEWLKKLLAALKEGNPEMDLTDLEAQITEGVKSEIGTATKSLEENKGKILAEKKSLQNKLKLFDGIDPEKYSLIQKQLEELELREHVEVGDLQGFKELLQKKHQAELDALNEKLSQSDSYISSLLIDQGLTGALTENRVSERFLPAVKALLMDRVQIQHNQETGDRAAVVGDVALKDYVKTWSESDEGKVYVKADTNLGGGAGGSGQGSGGKAPTEIKTAKDAVAQALAE